KVRKRANRQLQMLLARIFNLIVTDAFERLDEHHDRGDTGSGHLSCVMERTGWHPVSQIHVPRGLRGLGYAGFAKRDQARMKGDGLNTPDGRPFRRTSFLLRKLEARLAG